MHPNIQEPKDEKGTYIDIDDKDKKILEVLMENSRLSFRAIAKKTSLSTATVINRIKRLKDDDIIKGYTTKIDFEKIGYDLLAMIQVKISRGKFEQVENKIASNQHVIGMFDVTGDFDALILARFKSRKTLDYFIKRIMTYENIERTSTRLVLNVTKFENTPLF
jgi:DNA-binding Lrp family transcriptional regulator